MTKSDCPFCEIISNRNREWIHSSNHFVAIRDQYPVSEGHTLIIPRRHLRHLGDLPVEWGDEWLEFIRTLRGRLKEQFNPDGMNFGVNEEKAGGQTIDHLHVHLIPRYEGDVSNPEGGVRGVIPNKRTYQS